MKANAKGKNQFFKFLTINFSNPETPAIPANSDFKKKN